MTTSFSRRWMLAAIALVLGAPLSVQAQDPTVTTIAVPNPQTVVAGSGDLAAFEIEAVNFGDAPITDYVIEVVDVLPAGVGPVAATPDAGSFDGSTNQWTVTIDAQTSVKLILDYPVDADAPDGGLITVTTVPTVQADPAEVNIERNVALNLVAQGPAAPVLAGGPPTDFVFTLSNDGPSYASGIQLVVDALPPGVTVTNAFPGAGTFDIPSLTWTWPAGDTPNGTTAGMTLELTVDNTVAAGDFTVSGTATATETVTNDPVTASDAVTVESASDQSVGFMTSIAFTNGNTGTVTAMITCNAGLPLTNSFDISEGSPVTFSMTELPYTTPGTMCEIAIDGVASGYTAMGMANGGTAAASCMFDVSNFAVDGMNTCEFTAEPDVSEFSVAIDFVGIDDPSIDQDWVLDIVCSPASEDTGPVFGTVSLNTSGTGSVGIGRQFYADPTNGTDCTATVSGLASAIEQDGPCTVEDIAVGDDTAACTITATAFFEGIPTLSQYGMALMALLMLGVGFVGMRRFV